MAEIDKAVEKSLCESKVDKSNWTGPILRNWIKERFGKAVSKGAAYNILYCLGYSTTRSKKK